MVLALVFVLGLCTVGAAGTTTFTDEEQIQYASAVKAMNGLGIVVGYPDGSFKPTQNVTRAEAAKIISYVVVGLEVEKWPARQVFDDVPADHWAAKYVTFCEYNKIIAGYGNGKFGPDDPVTQAQLSRMLLSACGYGAKGEFLGEGWDQNVAALAFQTKILKGIKSTDWDAPATREETALLAYNCMMNTKRVVLSEDKDSYVAMYVNGIENVTFAQSPWGLTYMKGIVLYNKANLKEAKGTSIYVTECLTNSALVGNSITVESENDADVDILGHEVTVMYRSETTGTKSTRVAYYLDDECEEVSGAAANTAELADVAFEFENGIPTEGDTPIYGDEENPRKVTGYTTVGAAKNSRYMDTAGTYVLNAEGKIVAVKYSEFWIAPLSISPATGIATVKLDATYEVEAPEGAKNGDMMTVYQCGDVFSVKACTKTEKVEITQKKLVDLSAYYMRSYYTYNNGEIVPSDASNLDDFDLSTIYADRITMINSTKSEEVKTYLPDLTVGYSYTLYFDAEGGCFAYGDGVQFAEEDIGNFSVFITGYAVKDSFGDDQVYIQYIKADGTSATMKLPYDKEGKQQYGVKDNGDIYKLSDDTVIASPDQIVIVNAMFGTVKVATENAGSGKYNPADPLVDYSKATFVGYKGEKGSLKIDTTKKPDATLNVPIKYTYKLTKVGTTWVTKVETVWFNLDLAGEEVKEDMNSYIYVVDADTYQQIVWTEEGYLYYYNGYKDGTAMDDLLVSAQSPAKIGKGFFTYEATDKGYKLTSVPEGTINDEGAEQTGSVTYTLVDQKSKNGVFADDEAFILDGKLYVLDKDGNRVPVDVSSVKFVRLAQPTDADAYPNKTLNLSTWNAINSTLQSKNPQYTITVTFVERVTKNSLGISVYSAGGNVIYITAVSK